MKKQLNNNDAARFAKNRGQVKSGSHPHGAGGEQATAQGGSPQHKPIWVDAVVTRLRSSGAENDKTLAEEGAEDGREWAKTDAEKVELRRIADVRDRHGNWHFGEGSSAYSAAEILFFTIDPDLDRDRDSAAEFWEIMTGDRELPETAYVRGFAAGAMEIWDEVKDQI